MKNYHTIYIRRCRKVQKINSLRIRVHRYCELTYDTDDSCSTLYWKTHGTKQLLTKHFHRLLNQGEPPDINQMQPSRPTSWSHTNNPQEALIASTNCYQVKQLWLVNERLLPCEEEEEEVAWRGGPQGVPLATWGVLGQGGEDKRVWGLQHWHFS